MHRKVFISYRVADTRPTAGRLAADLRRTFGDEAVFLDYRSLEAAEQWPEQLQTEVASAVVVLVLIGKGWLTAQDEYGRRRIDVPNDWVRQEVAVGLREGGKVLPLLVNDAKPIPAAAVENLPDIAALATTQAFPLRDVDWQGDFAGLVDWLEVQGFEREVCPVAEDDATPAAPEWHGNPYRGLSAFRPEDAPIYHGRERETDELLRRVAAERVVAVIGPSGSGKTSLVAAGLIPQLSESWAWVRFMPAEAGNNPLRALARRLAPHLSNATSTDALVERLRTAPAAIDALAAEVLVDRAAGAQLLLFADQFEELFIARVNETYRAQFVDLVSAVAGSERTRLVLTLRADYTEHCTRYETLTTHLRGGTFLLGTPGVTALKAMVERPAQAAGLNVEPVLVDRILEQAGTEPGALALVEFTLEQLYDARADGMLTLATYNALDGVQGAIEVQGEVAVCNDSGQIDDTTLGNVFRVLATVDEHGGAVRKRAPLKGLEAGEREVVNRLITARLLVTDNGPESEATVEVAHEAVLRHWGRFVRWTEENQEFLLWHQRLQILAEQWQRSDLDKDALLRGAQLVEAEVWHGRRRPEELDELVHAFIESSLAARAEKAADRDQAVRRKKRWTRMSVVAALLFVAGLARWQFNVAQHQRASAEQARASAEQAQAEAARAGRALSALEGFFEVRRDLFGYGDEGPEMVVLPGGTFLMGSPETEKGRESDEGPQREVNIPAFAMGKTEVTFEEYDRFAKDTRRTVPDDEGWGRKKRPVINVEWKDAGAYAAWLSKKTNGKTYRLPSEAEWEYAARAGNTTRYWWGDKVGESQANCYGCGSRWDGKQPAPVNSFPPNAVGLHDTAGNVWEWVQDCYVGTYKEAPVDGSAQEELGCSRRLFRGGSWSDGPDGLRSAARGRGRPDFRFDAVGFRLAQDL